jgi:outer membrane lipoprotein SlyB
MRPIPLLLGAALLLSACSHASSTRYDATDVGRTIETTEASVISSRPVQISGETNLVGPAAGGALGAAGTGLIFQGSGLAAVIGGVLGAGVGYLSQQQLNDREGIEYVLRMDDGRTVTLVQNRESDEPPLPDGTPVLVQVSGQYTRVIADPRAERVGGADWVDPDTLPEAAIPGIGASPIGEEGDPEPLEEPPTISEQQ